MLPTTDTSGPFLLFFALSTSSPSPTHSPLDIQAKCHDCHEILPGPQLPNDVSVHLPSLDLPDHLCPGNTGPFHTVPHRFGFLCVSIKCRDGNRRIQMCVLAPGSLEGKHGGNHFPLLLDLPKGHNHLAGLYRDCISGALIGSPSRSPCSLPPSPLSSISLTCRETWHSREATHARF